MTPQSILTQHYAMMLKTARRLTRNATDAQDVVQIACVSVLASKTPLDGIDNIEAWVATCVRHASARRYRKESRYVAGGDAIASRMWVDGAQQYSAELADVRRALATTSAARREAFELMAVQGMTRTEAGAALGVSGKVAEARTRSAMTFVRAANGNFERRVA